VYCTVLYCTVPILINFAIEDQKTSDGDGMSELIEEQW
jgi:hypothetical protein